MTLATSLQLAHHRGMARYTYTEQERSTAKTLAISLGPTRARDLLVDLWHDPALDDAQQRQVPNATVIARWRDDPTIAVDDDWLTSYNAGMSAIIGGSAQRVLMAAEDAVVAALADSERSKDAALLVDVWRKAADRILAAPAVPSSAVANTGMLPPGLAPGQRFLATYEVQAAVAPPAPQPFASPAVIEGQFAE